MHVVIAPDSFKGSLTADMVADAIKRGWLSVRPDDTVSLLPLADGGEGTSDALARAMGNATVMPIEVTGPDGNATASSWLRIDEAEGMTGVVEFGLTSGIELLGQNLRPWSAGSDGFGQAIAAALAAGATRLILAIGSSASTDGGAGMLTALGATLLTADGTPIRQGVLGLEELASVDLSGLITVPARGVTVLTDVTNPLLGTSGAAFVYGPQKGIDDPDRADRALEKWAGLVGADQSQPGSGAAGGAGYALHAWGAALTSGAESVADLVGLADELTKAELVITGEGRFDAQSSQGKVISIVQSLAAEHDVEVALVAGKIDAETIGFVEAAELAALADARETMANPEPFVVQAAVNMATSYTQRMLERA